MPCVLFNCVQSRRGQLVVEPFRNWKKAVERFSEHLLKRNAARGDASPSSHKKTGTGYEACMNCATRMNDFLLRLNNSQEPVSVALGSVLSKKLT